LRITVEVKDAPLESEKAKCSVDLFCFKRENAAMVKWALTNKVHSADFKKYKTIKQQIL